MPRALLPAEPRPGPSPRAEAGPGQGAARAMLSSLPLQQQPWPSADVLAGTHGEVLSCIREQQGGRWGGPGPGEWQSPMQGLAGGPLCCSQRMQRGRRRACRAHRPGAQPGPGLFLTSLQVLAGCGEVPFSLPSCAPRAHGCLLSSSLPTTNVQHSCFLSWALPRVSPLQGQKMNLVPVTFHGLPLNTCSSHP